MGKSGNVGASPEEIFREKSKEIQLRDVTADEIKTGNKNVPPMTDEKKKEGDKKKKEIKRQGKASSNVKLEELKKNAGMLPHQMPSKKAVKNKAAKPLTKEQQKRMEAASEIESLHATLEREENRVFGKEGIRDIRRNRYASLSERDKKKRVDAALKRKANAAVVLDAEEGINELFKENQDLDRETFEKELRGFMMLTEHPFKMDKDDAFARNLKRNYELCQTAWRMKKWVSDAVEGGYFPKDFDLEAVEAKIARYFELKEYLDTQKELMKNPYYQYMAKGDISYTDEQIASLKTNTGNEVLRSYLTTVEKLRGLSFVRRKDMDSVMDKSVTEGKRQAEILRNREKKRQVMNTFEAEALEMNGNQRFRDRHYDERFTEEAFGAALDSFRKLKVKDLHFKSIRDIADHFKDNVRLFEENREFERMLMVAVQRNLAPADDEMIKLRSKIKAFKNAEYMMNLIQLEILMKPDRFLSEMTDREFIEQCRKGTKKSVAADEPYDIPVPGMDMDSYYDSVLKAVKAEHRNRNNEIRKAYEITHPVKHQNEKGKESWKLGEIPRNELNRLAADYQKNSFINDYIADLEHYTQCGYGFRKACFSLVYGKKKGKKIRSVSSRVLSRYTLGMSSKELKEVIDILEFGTAEKKAELWGKIHAEGTGQNLTEMDSEDPKVILNNMAYYGRVGGMHANFDEVQGAMEKLGISEEIAKEAAVMYDVGCGHSQRNALLCQIMDHKLLRSLSIKDMFSLDAGLVNNFAEDILTEARFKGSAVIDGKRIINSYDDTAVFMSTLQRMNMFHIGRLSSHNGKRAGAGYENTAYISMYEARKHHGLIKDTTEEELKEVRDFYRKNLKAGEKKESIIKGNMGAREKASAMENAFKRLMEFDLSLFNYKSYKDIVDSAGKDNERFNKCRDMSRLAVEILYLIPDYEGLRENGQEGAEGAAVCRLNEEHIREIRAKCMTIMAARPFFSEDFLNILESPAPGKAGMSLEEAMHLSKAELNEKMTAAKAAKDEEAAMFWGRIRNMCDSLEGFDMNMDLRAFLHGKRSRAKCQAEPMDQEILNILNKKAGPLKDVVIGEVRLDYESDEDFLERFAKTFSERKLSVSEREAKLDNTDSRLRTKRLNAEALQRGREEIVNARIAARRRIPLRLRMAAGEDAFMQLSAFMSGDQKEDEALIAEYADEKRRFGLLESLTVEIMGITFNADIISDNGFASNAQKLEEVSSKARAYDALLKDNPDYADRLKVVRPGEDKSDYDEVMGRVNTFLAISDYYRARAVLITDPYYITHYDNELSADHDEKSTEDQRRIADLIRLTGECLRRIDSQSSISRENAGMDALLKDMEMKSRRSAYLFGQADLKKADISYTKKADKEIARYFEKVKEEHGDLSSPEIEKIIAESKEEHPFPEAERYETEAVKIHLNMIKRYKCFMTNKYMKVFADERRKKLWDALLPVLSDMKAFEFNDPVTGDRLCIKTDPQRIINTLVFCSSPELPLEEVTEIIEGFKVMESEELDKNDPGAVAYARQRFLESMQKLFYLEYNSVKRFESTYGTLPDQLPPGSFMHSLGKSKALFGDRSIFGQDMAEISEEKRCRIDGKEISMGEYLVRNGMIKEDELSDAISLNGDYYLHVNGLYKQVHSQAVAAFEDDEDETSAYTHNYSSFMIQQYKRRNYDIKGPKINQDEERKYWKDAFSEGERTLYGNKDAMEFKKDHLNTYSEAELREIKEIRKNEAGLIHFYEETVRERAEVLSDRMKQLAGGDVDGELIERLIFFHPAILTEDNLDKIPEKDTEEFISFVRDFAGTGVPAEEKAERRSEAYQKMAVRMKGIMGSGFAADRPDALIDVKTYEDRNKKVNYRSKLMRTVVTEQVSDTVQKLMMEETDKSVIRKETYELFRERQKTALSCIILKHMKTDGRFLALKDLGNRELTVPDIELAEMERLVTDLNSDRYSLDGSFMDYRRGVLKKLYGIDIALRSEIIGEEEKKEEEKAQPEISTQKEEKSEEKDWQSEIIVPKAEKTKKKEKKKEVLSQRELHQAELVKDMNLDPLPQYKQDTGLTVDDYEAQGENNCWCVAGAAIFNRFMGKKIADQYKMRAFSPSDKEIRSFDETDKMKLGINKAEYRKIVRDLRDYMGKGCTEFGSIYQTADFFMKQNRNMAVRSMVFTVPSYMRTEEHKLYDKTIEEEKADIILYQKQKAVLLEELNKILSTGNPVAVLDTGKKHYRTITRIDGEMITLLDSLGRVEVTEHVDKVLRRDENSNMIELTWLSALRDPKDEMAEQHNLTYSDEKGYGLREYTTEYARNPMWMEGVPVSAGNDELMITRRAYLPKKK